MIKANPSDAYSDSDSESSAEYRKKHKNKYAKFSKKAKDPLDAAIMKDQRQRAKASIDYSSPVRGTTVPTLLASNGIEKSNNVTFQELAKIDPSDPFSFGYIKIGTVTAPHGVKGELKIQFESDFADTRLSPGSILYVKKPTRRSPRPVKVVSSRRQSDQVYLLQFEHIRTRIGASAFRRYLVYVKEQDRPPLEEDEYLIRDLIDLDCYLVSQRDSVERGNTNRDTCRPVAKVVGVIPPDELCDPGAAALMHAQLELSVFDIGTSSIVPVKDDGVDAPAVTAPFRDEHQEQQQQEQQQRLCLVPLVPNIVPVVDISNGRLFLEPPAGLLETTYGQAGPRRVVVRGYLPESIERLTAADRAYLTNRSRVRRVDKESGHSSLLSIAKK
eukprot:CAMPEP_0174977346 /NCGR_PEP_ID=MMETSP0004_2-20121128/13555_1 /TAXON_ID=420556 /ORGANISM="Ochromonas sp., Strain CCMP1393" /LENGTH=385 /DNA_ID=CAMNT_0016228513 /DNA_START=238 /DNA_END=1395 /DNA_ORIENTATION=+